MCSVSRPSPACAARCEGQAGGPAAAAARSPLLSLSLPLQDPAQADKLAKIQRDLDETKIILHKTIESVLDRGEKLDQVRRPGRRWRWHWRGMVGIY